MMLKQLLRSVLMPALLAAICASLPAAQAAPGDLDTSFAGFNGDGIAGLRFGSPAGLTLRPDGGFLVVKNDAGVEVHDFHADGYVFANYIIPNPFQTKFVAHDIALQADGKIVVAGYADHAIASDSIMLARLDRNGQLDPSFGEGGYVGTDFGQNQTEMAHKVLIQPDGKIVVVGYAHILNGNDEFAVVRYTPAGKPDATFGGGDGIVTIGLGFYARAFDMALQNDGKLVVVGVMGRRIGPPENRDEYDFGLVRLEADGSLDDNSNGDGGFRGNGKFNQDFGGGETYVGAVAIQPDGKIVVAGHDTHVDRSIVARFLPGGALDVADFNGWYFGPVGTRITDLALQPDGKIMAIGGLNGDTAFFRLNPTGTPDAGLNNSGIKAIDLGDNDGGTDIALLPDGRILGLAGSSSSPFTGLSLVRLWPDGTLDSGGKQTHGIISGSYEFAYALAVQPDGKLLVAGEVSSPNNDSSNAFVTRFRADGQVDTGFGPSGRGTIQTSTLGSTARGARAIALQPDGKIVIAGHSKGIFSSEDFLVARWHSNGAPDNSFGVSGFNHQPVPFPGNGDDYGTALALAPGGKIVVAGNVWNGSRQVWGVARLTSSGALDNTFDGDGLFTVGLDRSSSANAVAVQPDGKILVAGHIGGDFAVARLAENGALDPSFGQGGLAINNLGGTDVINALALAANGWIYAAGSRLQNGNEDFALAQYTPQGALAACPGGQTCNHWPTGTFYMNWDINDTAYALDLRGDNQLVAAGCANQRFAAVQVRTNGAPAPLAFEADFAGYQECARAVKFSGWNKIVLAGTQNLTPISRDWNIALARFETTGNSTVPPPTLPPPSNVYPVYLPIIVR
jgi:uncharacterized delta-60 repeat protein